MKRLLTLATGTVALTVASSAYATDFIPGTMTPTANFIASGDPFNGPVSATFGRSGLAAGTFTDNFIFQIGQNGLGSGSITTNFSGAVGGPTDLDFVTITFSNGVSTFDITPAIIGHRETGGLDDIEIFAGAINTLSVTYTSRGSGAFGGTLSFDPAATPSVPEPATWAMLIAGFAIIGGTMRRKNKIPVRARFAY